jgi:hypothetical protein
MDDILSTIDAALREKGLSDAAASKLAVGHPSLLKNLRLPREGEKRYNLAALMRLADVLGLEFYFGPRRRAFGFAEPEKGSDLGREEALRAGFLPLPWHPAMNRRGSAPVAFARAWLEQEGLVPDTLSAIEPDEVRLPANSADAPLLAVIDSAARRHGPPSPWALVLAGRILLAQVQFEPRATLLFGVKPDGSARVLFDGEREVLRTLGRVVWLGQSFAPAAPPVGKA